jgi:hypothetical protein
MLYKSCVTCDSSQPLSSYSKYFGNISHECNDCRYSKDMKCTLCEINVVFTKTYCESCKLQCTKLEVKKCTQCSLELKWSEFNKSKLGLFGLSAKCKLCVRSNNKTYYNTMINRNAFFENMLGTCKRNAERRSSNGRLEAGTCTLTIEEIQQKFDSQNGKCYLTGIAMQLTGNSDWRCSPERLDNTKGYTNQNIVFIIAELNGACQMTNKKLETISLLKFDVNEQLRKVESDVMKARAKRGFVPLRKKIEKISNGCTYLKCYVCSSFVLSTDFYPRITTVCKSCYMMQISMYRRTLRGRLNTLLQNSNSRYKEWCKSNQRSEAQEFDLTISGLIDLYDKQNGRCAYSGIPLQYDGDEWIISIERINVAKGYVFSNICLIASEFQVGDYRASSGTSTGTYMSKDKFEHIISSFKKKNTDRITSS